MDPVLMTKLRVTQPGTDARRLTAVAAYEDSATETRVNEFCTSLVQHLGRKCEVTKHMWLLSELRVSQLRTIAAGEAAAADVILVSLHHADSLPAEVENWVELWLARKGPQPKVLLALFDPPHRGISTSMQARLKEAASRGRMEFLVQTEESLD